MSWAAIPHRVLPLPREPLWASSRTRRAVAVLLEPPQVDEVLLKQDVDERKRKAPSAPGRMKWCSSASSAVRLRRGSITTIRPPRSWMPRSRRAHQAPPRGCRLRRAVRAQRKQVGGAVEIGDGDAQITAEHELRGHVLGHLVHGRRGVDVPCQAPSRARGRRSVRRDCAHSGCRDRGRRNLSMFGEDRCKAAVDLSKCLIPCRFLKSGAFDQWRPDAIRVLVQGFEPVALGADEPVAEDVVGVALDLRDHAIRDGELEATGRLAERARAKSRERVRRRSNGHAETHSTDRTPVQTVIWRMSSPGCRRRCSCRGQEREPRSHGRRFR